MPGLQGTPLVEVRVTIHNRGSHPVYVEHHDVDMSNKGKETKRARQYFCERCAMDTELETSGHGFTAEVAVREVSR